MENKGVKHSEGKLPLFTVLFKQFGRALQEIVRASNGGHLKYSEADQDWMNWSRVKDPQFQYMNAAMRHLLDKDTFNEDMKQYDPKIRHKAQAIWNLLCSLELELLEEEKAKKFILDGGLLPTEDVSRLEGLPDNSSVSIDNNWTWRYELKDIAKAEGMDKPHEIKETSKLVVQDLGSVSVPLTEEEKVKFEELRKIALERENPSLTWQEECQRRWKETATHPYPWYEYGKNPYHNLDGTTPRLKPDQLIDKKE